MNPRDLIESAYPGRICELISIHDIPKDGYLVYILIRNEQAVVVGHGRYNRARVIFDDINTITPSHIKAIFVRIYHLFGGGHFVRYLIECDSKQEAQQIEKDLHEKIGGNKRALSDEITQAVFRGIEPESLTEMALRIALNSSFDGLSDIKLWRRKGILNDATWLQIKRNLRLPK